MHNEKDKSIKLPSPEEIHLAIRTYLRYAYDGPPPESTISLLPDEGNFDPSEWLMGEKIERKPPDAPLSGVRSAACRLGNSFYPNMKLRLSRPPHHRSFLFSVDCHDAFLSAPSGSPDHSALEELKARNASLANTIHSEWDRLSLPTERNYLRRKIQQAKRKAPPPPDEDGTAKP
ncbi:MAG TPA: hypothetical protein ENH84_02275 [Phycisphaerae bacterium]|nr:hypothetical protein [Phycisphaerae bacterium]